MRTLPIALYPTTYTAHSTCLFPLLNWRPNLGRQSADKAKARPRPQHQSGCIGARLEAQTNMHR